MANEPVQRVNETMKYVKENYFRWKLPTRSLKLAILCILLIFNNLTGFCQSLKLDNATVQQLNPGIPDQTGFSFFVMCTVKGNVKLLEADSLCVLNFCFPLINPDSSIITKEIIRGKKNSFLRLTINFSQIENEELRAVAASNKQISGVLYYKSNAKRKQLLIPIFHQLPIQTVKE